MMRSFVPFRIILLQEQFTVYIAHDGKTALHILRSRSPQIMLLDLMLPGMDGFEVCRRVRQFSDIPIIMLTAKMMKQIVSSVFYWRRRLCGKAFHVKELIARVNSLLRRANGEVIQRSRQIHIRDLEIDVDKFYCGAMETSSI